MTTIAIDLNVRLRGGETYAGFEDVQDGTLPEIGEVVRVIEVESELQGKGEVRRIDPETRLIYLAVDWAALRPPIPRIRNADVVVLDSNVVSGLFKAHARDQFVNDLGTMFHIQNMVGLRCNVGEMRPSAFIIDSDVFEDDDETILANSAD